MATPEKDALYKLFKDFVKANKLTITGYEGEGGPQVLIENEDGTVISVYEDDTYD
jgi:hypothetical protein